MYEGSRSFYKESDPCAPVNQYGAAKLEAERLVQQRWPGRHAILRSSVIFGPPPPQPVRRALWLQQVEAALAAGTPYNAFSDEWRTPTYIRDLVRSCDLILTR